MKRTSILITFSSLILALTQTTNAAERFDQLQGRLEAAKIKTVDAAIPLLSVDLRTNFTFMHISRSIQGASPEFPRAILWTNDAKLMVSFNGHASQDGNDRLEVIEYNENEARFEFNTINETPEGLVFHNEDQGQMCFGCHGMTQGDLKPVWDIYRVWRGAYGSNDDQLAFPGSEQEKSNYVAFLKGVPSHPRYSKLKFNSKNTSTPPFADKLEQGFSIELRPNMRFGFLINRLVAKRVVRQIREHGDQAAVKALSTLMSCPQTPMDDTLKATLEPRILSWITRTHGPAGYDNEFISMISGALTTPMTRLFQVARDLGIPNNEWSTTQEKNSNAMFEGTAFSFDQLVARELYEQLMQSMPELRPFYSRIGFRETGSTDKGIENFDALGGVLGKQAIQACPLLKL